MPRALTALPPGRPLGSKNKVVGALRREMEERGLRIIDMIEEVWNSALKESERANFLLGIMKFTHPSAREEDHDLPEHEKPIIIMSREDMIKLAKGSGG
jgi:hypothetical protein